MQLATIKRGGTTCEVDDGAGPFLISGRPFRFNEGNTAPGNHIAALGSDGSDILAQWLQLEKDDIDRIEQAGAFVG